MKRTIIEINEEKCRLAFYVAGYTDSTGIPIPEWMDSQEKDKSYMGYVLPVRYI